MVTLMNSTDTRGGMEQEVVIALEDGDETRMIAWLRARGAVVTPQTDGCYRLRLPAEPPDERDALIQQYADRARQAEEDFSTLLSDIDLGILLQSPEGQVLAANPTASRLLHIDPGKLTDRPLSDGERQIVHADGRPFIHEDHPSVRAIREQTAVHDVVMGLHRPRLDDWVWLLVSAVPQFNTDGSIRHVICSFSDITRLRQTEELLRTEHDLLQSVLDTSIAAITIVNPAGELTYANQKAEEILGLTRDELTEREYNSPEWRHTDIDGGPWPDEKQPFTIIMKTGEPVFDIQHAIQWPDGQRKLLSINGAPIKNATGEIVNLVFLVHDITEEERLRAEARDKERLNVALEKERELNGFRRRFMASVSHEIRTPITMISSATQILQRYAHKIDAQQQRDYLDKIQAQVRHLTHMLDDVSLVIQSQSNEMHFEPKVFTLDTLCERIVEDARLVNAGQNNIIYTKPQNPVAVIADPRLLQHIVNNLLHNALKYSPDGGDVHVTLKSAGKLVTLIVADEGIGIPAAEQKRLFDSYFRASNVSNISGTGLGLKIVQDCVALHSGTIQMTSEEGEGSIFTVELPIVALT